MLDYNSSYSSQASLLQPKKKQSYIFAKGRQSWVICLLQDSFLMLYALVVSLDQCSSPSILGILKACMGWCIIFYLVWEGLGNNRDTPSLRINLLNSHNTVSWLLFFFPCSFSVASPWRILVEWILLSHSCFGYQFRKSK